MRTRQLKTLLYVDDEPDIREIVELALALIDDLAVHTADSAKKALALMPALKPDLVLLDVMMPDMDGLMALRRMRAERELESIPVIFVTARAMPEEVELFCELGVAGVIAKPFDPMQLGAQVVTLWDALADR